MAEPHDHGAAADRYAAIEAAYCDDRWEDVLTQGRQLLGDLGSADDALATALRQRLHLLMAHTHLHGLGDRDTAEDLYRQVLNTAHAEPALRRTADEGLQQCDRPTIRPATATKDVSSAVEPPGPTPASSPERPLPEPVAPPLAVDPAVPFSAGTASSGSGPIRTAATPWLEANPAPPAATVPVGEIDEKAPAQESEPPSTATKPPPSAAPSLLAEVVEEPELLDVHQADPHRAEEIELELREPPSTAAAAAQALAAAVTAEAMAEVAAGRAEPDAHPVSTVISLNEPEAAETVQEEPAIEELTIAEVPTLPPMEEDEDDPDLLEGLLQVALG
ncbi:hypothetical protein NZK32_00710 [Cyanobium sp. FGCU-52]|nr:hypothetical protein [Cyanobium sp. FGCU52]